MPWSSAIFTRADTPPGSLFLSTPQSPKAQLSVRRGYFTPNHPSSITKSSPPIDAISPIIWSIPASLISKYTPSQLFRRILRGTSPWAILWFLPHLWKLRLTPLIPSSEYVRASSGVLKTSLEASLYEELSGFIPAKNLWYSESSVSTFSS